jgi:hypothetical protein
VTHGPRSVSIPTTTRPATSPAGSSAQSAGACSASNACSDYDTLRARKVGHHAALRQLANRLVGILHGCLKTGTKYDENTAWQHRSTAAA